MDLREPRDIRVPISARPDMFTKALDKATFIKFRDMMMNNHTSLREALSAAVCGLHGEASRLAKRLMRQL